MMALFAIRDPRAKLHGGGGPGRRRCRMTLGAGPAVRSSVATLCGAGWYANAACSVAFVPLIIRWGPEASSNLIRRSERCTMGATLQHPCGAGMDLWTGHLAGQHTDRGSRVRL